MAKSLKWKLPEATEAYFKKHEDRLDIISTSFLSEDARSLFQYIINPLLLAETISEDEKEHALILAREMLKERLEWSEATLEKAVKAYLDSATQELRFFRHRRKICAFCDHDMTETFMTSISADDLLSESIVLIKCRRCKQNNFVKARV
jgi:hypothetical protein